MNPLRPPQVDRRVQRRGICAICAQDVAATPNGEAGHHFRYSDLARGDVWCHGYCFMALDVKETSG